jgi:hypothetical protein
METTKEMQALVAALRKVRHGYPSTQAMAAAAGLEYPALWRVLDGRGRRSVGIEFLTTAMAKWPEVAAAMQAQVAQKEEGNG